MISINKGFPALAVGRLLGRLRMDKNDSRHFAALKYAMEKICDSEVSGYVDELYLYGSYSRGTHRWDSDIDLLLVLDERARILKAEVLKLKSEVTMDDLYAVKVDIKVVFGGEWKKSPMLFFTTIKEESKKLW